MHGVFDGEVSHDGENLIVDGTKIKVTPNFGAWYCNRRSNVLDPLDRWDIFGYFASCGYF